VEKVLKEEPRNLENVFVLLVWRQNKSEEERTQCTEESVLSRTKDRREGKSPRYLREKVACLGEHAGKEWTTKKGTEERN